MDRLRERARELAKGAFNRSVWRSDDATLERIESAILRGMVEALEAEPDEWMVERGRIADPLSCDVPDEDIAMIYGEIFRAMAAERAKGLK